MPPTRDPKEAPAPAGASGVPETHAAAGPSEAAPQAPQGSEDLEVSILPDGRVQIHARCRVGEDPAACAERVRGFVEALGVPEEAVVEKIEPRGGSAPQA